MRRRNRGNQWTYIDDLACNTYLAGCSTQSTGVRRIRSITTEFKLCASTRTVVFHEQQKPEKLLAVAKIKVTGIELQYR